MNVMALCYDILAPSQKKQVILAKVEDLESYISGFVGSTCLIFLERSTSPPKNCLSFQVASVNFGYFPIHTMTDWIRFSCLRPSMTQRACSRSCFLFLRKEDPNLQEHQDHFVSTLICLKFCRMICFLRRME